MAYPTQTGGTRARRGNGQLGFLPAAVPLAQKVGGKVLGAAKKLIGAGPDPKHHASRESAIATALQLARQGRLDAFLWLRAATGGFNAKQFQIPVPPVPELGFTGGIATGLGDKQAKRDAAAAYNSVKALFPQVPEHGNTILASGTSATGGGGGTQPPAPPSGGSGGGTVSAGTDSGSGGSAGGDGTSAASDQSQVTAPQQAGLGLWGVLAIGGAALAAAFMTRGPRRGVRRVYRRNPRRRRR